MCVVHFINILQNELNKDNEKLNLEFQKTIEKEVSFFLLCHEVTF